MSTLKTAALRGTSGTADSVQLHASNQSVTFPGAVTITGALTSSTTSLGGLTGVTTGSGNVTISDGDLIIGTSGHGISFSATSDVAGMASELLDDYEEGTWTPDSPAASASSNSGKYTKIGNQVIFEGSLTFGSESGNNRAEINGLPFSAAGNYGGGYIRYTNVNPGEEWFSLDIGNGTAIIQMNESSPDSIKRVDVSTKRIDFCGQYIV